MHLSGMRRLVVVALNGQRKLGQSWIIRQILLLGFGFGCFALSCCALVVFTLLLGTDDALRDADFRSGNGDDGIGDGDG
jgi:hypothetical protein